MRYFLFFIFSSLSLFAHSMHDQADLHHDTINYGFFANLAYRDLDLYPRGVEGSVGYENHGEIEKLQIHHIGLFLDGNYQDSWLYGMEINRHVDAPSTLDSYLEKFYLGYRLDGSSLLVGRLYDSISFINQKAWGYGFAQMPISVDSLFDGSYITDGLKFAYQYEKLTATLHLAQEKYTKTNRVTLRFAYKDELFEIASYAQVRDKTKIRVDYASTQHLHSHDNQGECDNLEFSERCFERESKLFGIALNAHYQDLDYLAEYIYLDTKGDVSNNQYKADNHNKISTLYGQVIYNPNSFSLGVRGEYFNFDNTYKGAGAYKITQEITNEHSNSSQYLFTVMGSYELNSYNKTIVQAEKSQDDWALRLNHTFIFNSGF